MNVSILSSMSAMLSLLAAVSVTAQTTPRNVGVVDVAKVFGEYYKVKDAKVRMAKSQKIFQEEMGIFQSELKKLVGEFNEIQTKLKNPNLDNEALRKQAKEKIKVIRTKEGDVKQYQERTRATLRQREQNLLSQHTSDIRDAIAKVATAKSLDLVLSFGWPAIRPLPQSDFRRHGRRHGYSERLRSQITVSRRTINLISPTESDRFMRVTLTTEEILRAIGDVEEEGDFKEEIIGIASLELARPGDLAFLGNAKYRHFVPESEASIILLPKQYKGSPKSGQLYIRVPDPSHVLALLCKNIEIKLFPPPPAGIHGTAWVHPKAKVSSKAHVGAFAYIGEGTSVADEVVIDEHVTIGRHVSIGLSCQIRPRVIIADYCELGQQVILQSGVVIGSDGYGYDFIEGAHRKVPHVGKVVIEDSVEVGANTTVDRSRFSETRIGEGTKIDNLVQIAHNVRIGKHCLIIAQVGISGSTVIEDYAVIGGQAGLAGHLRVGAGAKIAGQAGITKNVEPGAYLKGNPALPYMLAQRIAVLQKRLPELFKRFASEDPSA